jgi:hypothetical protein
MTKNFVRGAGIALSLLDIVAEGVGEDAAAN